MLQTPHGPRASNESRPRSGSSTSLKFRVRDRSAAEQPEDHALARAVGAMANRPRPDGAPWPRLFQMASVHNLWVSRVRAKGAGWQVSAFVPRAWFCGMACAFAGHKEPTRIAWECTPYTAYRDELPGLTQTAWHVPCVCCAQQMLRRGRERARADGTAAAKGCATVCGVGL